MQLITLHVFPEDGSTWTAEEFLDKIDETCRHASLVCDWLVFTQQLFESIKCYI